MHSHLATESFLQIQANGLAFRVFDQGKGDPVLLLHGFPDDLEIWSGVIPFLLEAGYQVVVEAPIACFFATLTKREYLHETHRREMLGYPVSTVKDIAADPHLAVFLGDVA